jgi:hypothetical protein
MSPEYETVLGTIAIAVSLLGAVLSVFVLSRRSSGRLPESTNGMPPYLATLLAIFAVAIVLSVPREVTAWRDPVKVEIEVNGRAGVVLVANGTSYSYAWRTENATACQMTAPTLSGIPLSGHDGPIEPGHPWYPAQGGASALTITCTNGRRTSSATATVVISN